MASRRRRALLLAAVGLTLLPAACGSDDDGGEGSQPTDAQTTGAQTTDARTTDTQTTDGAAVEAPDLDRLPTAPAPSEPPPSSAELGQRAFLTAVFDDAEALWEREFAEAGVTYRPARLTIFRDAVDTACGEQPADVGPFYCPASSGVYLDGRFFAALSASMGVRLGDFAQAYVIAHEIGHHVQVQLGISARMAAANQRDPAGENARSVRFELQADCLAGVWMHSVYRRGEVSSRDIADALQAAAVIGDDVQQRRATGTVVPEDWTHGSAAQRQRWLGTGFESGRPADCDTFAPR